MTLHVFEEHASVLPHWHALGLHQATAVVLDAHLDLQFIDPPTVQALAQCPDTAALRARQAWHPFGDGGRSAYGIEDFLLPAVQLGLLARVVWVAPPHVMPAGLAPALLRLVQMEGVGLADVESFALTPGGGVEGRLLGVPLAIVHLDHLGALLAAAPAGPQVLDIDLDYFVRLPQERLWCDPDAVARTLARLLPQADARSASRSVGSGFTPPAHGHLDSVLARHLGPRVEADAGLDPWPVLLVALGAAHARGLPPARAPLAAWAERLRGGELTSPAHAAAAWVLLGLLALAQSQDSLAAECDARSQALDAGHPELALQRLLRPLPPGADAPALRERALAHGGTRSRALHAAGAQALHAKDPATARHWLQQAVQRTPAWPQAWQDLARSLQALGDTAGAQAAARQAAELHQRLSRQARRLAAALEPAA